MKKFHACKINSSIHKIQIKEEKHLSHMGTRFIRKLDFEVESKWRRKRKRRPLSLSLGFHDLHSAFEVARGPRWGRNNESRLCIQPSDTFPWLEKCESSVGSVSFSPRCSFCLSPTLPLSVAAHNARASRGAPATSYYNVKL